MHYVNIIQDLIRWIEQNLDRSLSVDDVAKKSGYSKWHLQRIFKAETGNILGTYIRTRRLTHAAIALRLTNKPILDIAMQYQFDSQQTFTRAFKKQFQQTPASYRKIPTWRLDGITPYLELTPAPQLTGQLTSLCLTELVGKTHHLSCSITELFEAKNNFRGPFWHEYFKKNHHHQLPSKIYGITESKPSKTNHDERNVFYITAVERQYTDNDNFTLEPLPTYQGEYIHFHFADHPSQFMHFIMRIYAHHLPKLKLSRREGPDIEVISLQSIDMSQQGTADHPNYIECDYYIPIIKPEA